MQDRKVEKEEEKMLDIKGTFESFIEEEEPELSQIEAIKAYKEGDKEIYKKKSNKNDDNDELEDDDHLKRVKQSLIESLEKVDILEKKIFEDKEKDKLKDIKVGVKDKQKQKEREQVMQQMREKIQEEQERSRE